jgi:RNA polymerase sigma factor (sigma-70 family)
MNQAPLILTESEIIARLRQQDRATQRSVYERYSPVMFGVAKRYLKSREDCEDVIVEAFFKVFDKIDMFKEEGSFEGWIRRIVVNECLMTLRKRHNFSMTVEFSGIEIPTVMTVEDELDGEDVIALLDKLPTGYRTVFNLFVMEGFKHREIAELLNISINTSKSQLILAKEKLRQLIEGDASRRATYNR